MRKPRALWVVEVKNASESITVWTATLPAYGTRKEAGECAQEERQAGYGSKTRVRLYTPNKGG